jgi:hypothetical protein
MSGKVSKYCSILNYLKDHNKDFYELVQELCLGRIFSPKRNGGITFLNPDKDLTKELLDMAKKDDEIEAAVNYIRSLIVLEHVARHSELEGKTTHLKKKLSLSGGCKVSDDPKFKPRDFRSSDLSVFKLSGALVPTNTEASEESEAKPSKRKVIKGSGEIDADRTKFFENIFELHRNNKDNKRNPAMEVLVSLVEHFESENKDIANLIKSQMSYDALTSLAIVLRPYSKENKGLYISDDDYSSWKAIYHDTFNLYSYVLNPYEKYNQYRDSVNKNDINKVVKEIRNLKDSATKATILTQFNNSQFSVNMRNDQKINLAEAELRTVAFNYFTVEESFNFPENFYKPYTLDNLCLCVHSNMDLAFYYSVPYLMCRSSLIFYLPGVDDELKGKSESASVASESFVNVDCIFKNSLSNSKEFYATQQKEIEKAFNELQKRKGSV